MHAEPLAALRKAAEAGKPDSCVSEVLAKVEALGRGCRKRYGDLRPAARRNTFARRAAVCATYPEKLRRPKVACRIESCRRRFRAVS